MIESQTSTQSTMNIVSSQTASLSTTSSQLCSCQNDNPSGFYISRGESSAISHVSLEEIELENRRPNYPSQKLNFSQRRRLLVDGLETGSSSEINSVPSSDHMELFDQGPSMEVNEDDDDSGLMHHSRSTLANESNPVSSSDPVLSSEMHSVPSSDVYSVPYSEPHLDAECTDNLSNNSVIWDFKKKIYSNQEVMSLNYILEKEKKDQIVEFDAEEFEKAVNEKTKQETDGSEEESFQTKVTSLDDNEHGLDDLMDYQPVDKEFPDLSCHEIDSDHSFPDLGDNEFQKPAVNSKSKHRRFRRRKNKSSLNASLNTALQVRIEKNNSRNIIPSDEHRHEIEQSLLGQQSTSKTWSLLDDLIVSYLKEKENYTWLQIAKCIDHRHTQQAVQMRYLRALKNRDSQFTDAEQRRLMIVVKQDWSARWTRIVREMGPSFNEHRIKKEMANLIDLETNWATSTEEISHITVQASPKKILIPVSIVLSARLGEFITKSEISNDINTLLHVYLCPGAVISGPIKTEL